MRLPTSFRQRLKFNNDCKIWYSDTIYYVSMIHELKIKQEYYLKHNKKLFQRLSETAEFEMVNSYANRINSGVDSRKKKKLYYNRCKAQNISEEGIIAFKELIEEINNNYSKIILDINYIKDLFKKFSKYTKDKSNKVFTSSTRKEEFLGRVCYTFNNVLIDQYFEKLDRLLIFSTFINYIGNNIKSSPLNELLLNIINYIILLQNGYSIGKYIDLFKESLALSYYNDAVAVCEKIGIPLHRVDFVREYWDYVFTYFLDELKKGRTPNPDIMCNKYIKFDMFEKEAKKLGADYIATGHYARFVDGKLLRGIDSNKDQTYFLSQVSLEQFKNVLFPIGNMEKTEVRKIAEEYDLITAHKKDSTGICFIGERNFKNFLKNYLPNQEGNVINIETGEIIGKHIGLMNYTIGQRRGLNIGGTKDKMFVVGKDLNKNVLYICLGEDNDYLISTSALVEDVNYIGEEKLTSCTAKFRYRGEDYPVELEWLPNNEVLVKYEEGVKSVTPGQACVFYDNEICLGG